MAIFLLFYKFLLEKENMHLFKRFYLLGTMIASLLIPLVVFTEYVPMVVEQGTYPIETVVVSVQETPPAQDIDTINFSLLFWSIYLVGVAGFGFRFIRNLFQILQRIHTNPRHELGFATHVLLRELMTPHTFFKYIFLNKKNFEAKAIPKEVLLHEETHARQYHSIDVLFIELLQVVLWFNPFIYLFTKSIKLNHEFLADRAVLQKDINTITYQNTLLSYLSPDSEKKYQPTLANAINYSSIKKRFTIMKTHTSKKSIALRSLLLLPLMALLLTGFSETKTVTKSIEQLHSIEGVWLDKDTENYKLSVLEENGSMVLYISGNVFPIEEVDGSYSVNVRETYYPIKFHPSTGMLQFNKTHYISESNSHRGMFAGSWVNTTGDTELIIENYTASTIWTITKDGRTNKYYPKRTKEGYYLTFNNIALTFHLENDLLNDSEGNVYHRKEGETSSVKSKLDSKSTYEIEIKLTKEGQIFIHDELIALEELAAFLEKYKPASVEDEKPQMVRSVVYAEQGSSQKTIEKIDKILHKYGSDTINIVGVDTPSTAAGITAEELKEYKKLLEKYSKTEYGETRVLLKEVERVQKLYLKMTPGQRSSVKRLATFSETTARTQDGATKAQLAEYNKIARKYNEMDRNNMTVKIRDVERLEYLYSLLNENQKADAQPFPDFPPMPEPPYAPEAPEAIEIEEIREATPRPEAAPKPERAPAPEIIEEIEVVEKRMPIPPRPPAPQDPLDHAIEMAKKGAIFYYEGTKISSDKAIELLKKNKSINMDSRNSNGKKPVIKLSKKPIKIGANSKDVDRKNILINGVGKTRVSFTKKEIQNLILETADGDVTEFKIKIPGNRSQTIKGNRLNTETKNLIASIDAPVVVSIFHIKTNPLGADPRPITVQVKI